ncbi:HEAT repeat-conatining protein isoform X1 [Solanum lycopersicum]|uniref:TOG domain-containing protein n=1 Tax=Solanum lycopersicum TaxID=4081 RepID=A0A3Q7F8F8_SOLLC|nr:HEAT repeat-conatining protein [Solanum lycopersicum]
MMSEEAARDLIPLPEAGMNNEIPSNGSVPAIRVESIDKNSKDKERENPALLVGPCLNGDGKVNTGAEVGNSEVEYIESENLNDVEDVDTSLKTLLTGLDSKDWVLVCEALNDVRRLSLFHKEAMVDMLRNVISLVVKSLKNPRSAVCKTAIMASADIFKAYCDTIVDLMDPLLVQLLLKSSQDKRFVCEAAEKALKAMTMWVSPSLLLPKLQPNLKHRNPRIRAKASSCFSRSVPRLGVEGIKAYGIENLIRIAASQLSDQLPESREAARSLLLELQNIYEKAFNVIPPPVVNEDPETITVSEDPETISWEHFCQSKLSPLSAQAVLRVTNLTREGIVLGS